MKLSNPFRKSRRAEQQEVKGFYASAENSRNEYFRELFGWFRKLSGVHTWSMSAEREALYKLFADKDKGNSTLYSVVSGIASAMGDILQFAELLDGNKNVVEGHWTINLLEEPNDAMTLSELAQLYAVNLLVVGDAFIYGQPAIAKLGGRKFSSIYVMPSHMVEIVSGGVLAPIAGYRLTSSRMLGATPPKMTPENVMFSRLPNPAGDTFHGLSPIITALKKVEIMESGDKQMDNALKNGGPINLVYPTQSDNIGFTQQQINDFDQMANEAIGNKTKFVTTPISSVRLGDTVADLSILQSSEYATQAICNVYAYPLDLLYSRSTYANMNEAKKMRYLIALPYANAFLDKFSKWTGCKEEGLKWAVNTDKIEVLKPDANQVISAMVNAGTTINERRDYLGFERLPDPMYDMVTYPMGMAFGGMNDDLSNPLPEND